MDQTSAMGSAEGPGRAPVRVLQKGERRSTNSGGFKYRDKKYFAQSILCHIPQTLYRNPKCALCWYLDPQGLSLGIQCPANELASTHRVLGCSGDLESGLLLADTGRSMVPTRGTKWTYYVN